jgi:hypothetical protein
METTETFETKMKMVTDHLIYHKKITSWEAIKLYRATRLSAMIFNLKERGHRIETEMVYENKTRYAVYHYAGMNQLQGQHAGN